MRRYIVARLRSVAATISCILNPPLACISSASATAPASASGLPPVCAPPVMFARRVPGRSISPRSRPFPTSYASDFLAAVTERRKALGSVSKRPSVISLDALSTMRRRSSSYRNPSRRCASEAAPCAVEGSLPAMSLIAM